MVRQATRYTVVRDCDDLVNSNASIRDRVDESIYFAKFDLHEPTDGSSNLVLGNWVELLSADEQDAGVTPARSKDNYDEGMFTKNLAKPADCTSNMRLAVIDFRHWPIKVFLNFIGTF